MKSAAKLIIILQIVSMMAFGQSSPRIQDYEKYTVLITQPVLFHPPDSLSIPLMFKSLMCGTGVIVYDNVWGTNSYYLVTNMHFVVHDSLKLFLNQTELIIKGIPNNSSSHMGIKSGHRFLPLIRNKNEKIKYFSEFQYVDMSNKDLLWKNDSSSFSDLIVIKINPEHILKESAPGPYIYEQSAINLSEIVDYSTTEIGDEIFTLGYPEVIGIFNDIKARDRIRQNFANEYIPVFRSGHIAAKPKEIICTFQKETILARNVFVNELFIYPGQSGSPVFLKRENKIYLMGIASAYFHYKNEINNSGLSLAWPAEIISKIIKNNKDFYSSIIFDDENCIK